MTKAYFECFQNAMEFRGNLLKLVVEIDNAIAMLSIVKPEQMGHDTAASVSDVAKAMKDGSALIESALEKMPKLYKS